MGGDWEPEPCLVCRDVSGAGATCFFGGSLDTPERPCELDVASRGQVGIATQSATSYTHSMFQVVPSWMLIELPCSISSSSSTESAQLWRLDFFFLSFRFLVVPPPPA